MKQFAIFLSLCMMTLVLAACGQNNLEKLNGQWQLDADATAKAMPKDSDELEKKALSLFSSMTFDINSEAGTLRRSMGPLTRDGKFEITSNSGDTLKLKLDDGTEFSFTFTGDSTAKVQKTDDPMIMIFTKK